MSSEFGAKERISCNWVDRKVAKWVILNLPLLELGLRYKSCPVYTLDLDIGLSPTVDSTSKIVISGGFEGTNGHMAAIDSMREYKNLALTPNEKIVLMLEPDSYIIRQKKRDPILNLDERKFLWSTSGLVDSVVLLPEKPINMEARNFYTNIHNLIMPAIWCVNIENKSWLEILMRGETQKIIDAARLFDHKPYIHSSFLASTKFMSLDETIATLRKYSSQIAANPQIYSVNEFISVEQRANILFKRLSQGL